MIKIKQIYRGARGPGRMRKALVRSLAFVRRYGCGLRPVDESEIIQFQHIIAVGHVGCRFYKSRRWFVAAHAHAADKPCGFDDPSAEEMEHLQCCFAKHLDRA